MGPFFTKSQLIMFAAGLHNQRREIEVDLVFNFKREVQ
jgi:hypothetical protein